MSEVKRYRCVGREELAETSAENGLVLGVNYDAARLELAALREELASRKAWPEWAEIQVLKNGVAERDMDIEQLQQRLAAAEQRNVELVAAIVSLPDEFKELSGCENTAGVYACIDYISGWVAELAKPTES